MKKTIRLTENDLMRIVKKVIKESKFDGTMETQRRVYDITDHINYLRNRIETDSLSDEEYSDIKVDIMTLEYDLESLGFYYDEESMYSFPFEY